jgi:hypothetical protein
MKKIRKTRVVKIADKQNILYIRHLGCDPYNEVKFACGKKVIVCYSLRYWHSVFDDFKLINKNVLINPSQIISESGIREVELIDNTKFVYSRRKLRNITA